MVFVNDACVISYEDVFIYIYTHKCTKFVVTKMINSISTFNQGRENSNTFSSHLLDYILKKEHNNAVTE